jgi:hypothetical protein
LQLKKKAAVIAGSAVAAIAIGTGAWAYVSAAGTGTGTATTSTAPATLTLHATATITDLETPAAISVDASSTKANRHISHLTVSLGTLPDECAGTTFVVSTPSTPFGGYTFPDTSTHTLDPHQTITMKNNDADQKDCVGKPIPLVVNAD